MANTVWVVRKGRNPGIYYNAKEAQKQVHKFKGGEIKKFAANATTAIQKYLNDGVAKQTKTVKQSQSPSTSKKKQRLYAVKTGKVPGVYATMEEANKQLKGVSGAYLKTFKIDEVDACRKFMGDAFNLEQVNKIRARYGLSPVKISAKSEKQTKTSVVANTTKDEFVTHTMPQELLDMFNNDEDIGELETKATLQTQTPIIEDSQSTYNKQPVCLYIPDYPAEAMGTTCVVYSDGSYNPAKSLSGAGAVVFYQGWRKDISQPYPDMRSAMQYQNLAGELHAVLLALYEASLNNATHVIIYYDMNAVDDLANNKIKPTYALGIQYQQLLKAYNQTLTIEFRHVKAHNGNPYNTIADMLAKKAAGCYDI